MATSNQIIREGLAYAVESAINKADVYVPIDEKQVIIERTLTEAAPVILNQTNNEPIYQSRVVIGNVVSIMLAFGGIYGLFSSGLATAETLSVPTGILLANGFSLYGRLIARKPIGV